MGAPKMKNKNKSKEQLENEVNELRRRISELETGEIKHDRTRESLHESERMLSTLIGNLPGMAYRCLNDDNWTMQFISEGCHELTGYAPGDLIGNRTLSYNELIHLDDRRPAWEQVQQALAKRRPFRLVYRIQTAARLEKWVWEQGQGVFRENGDLLAIEGFVTWKGDQSFL